MAIPLALVMAGMTAAKMASDADREDRSIKHKSQMQRFSPWTGDSGGQVQYADQAGNIAQGVAGYYGMDQALENQKLMKDLVQAQRATASVNADASPYAFKPAGAVRGYEWGEPKYDQGAAWGETMNNPYAMARRGYR